MCNNCKVLCFKRIRKNSVVFVSTFRINLKLYDLSQYWIYTTNSSLVVHGNSISGLVVKSNVAIVGPRVRFPADAFCRVAIFSVRNWCNAAIVGPRVRFLVDVFFFRTDVFSSNLQLTRYFWFGSLWLIQKIILLTKYDATQWLQCVYYNDLYNQYKVENIINWLLSGWMWYGYPLYLYIAINILHQSILSRITWIMKHLSTFVSGNPPHCTISRSNTLSISGNRTWIID